MSKGGKGSRAETFGGIHAVAAVLQRAPERVKRLQLAPDPIEPALERLRALAQSRGISIERVGRERLDQQLPGFQNQGVVVHCTPRPLLDEKALITRVRDGLDLLLVLDGVTDPHNLGACLRTADAAGVHAVIVPRKRSAGLTATVVKVASGAAETVPLVQVTNLARTMRHLQEAGVWITGTAGEASDSLYAANLTGPTALVMGAEGEGMRRLTREHCDHLVHLPMQGQVSSLNVSVAAGVCLFEAVRQRQL